MPTFTMDSLWEPRRVGELRIHYNVNDTEILTYLPFQKGHPNIAHIHNTYFIVWESKNNGGTLHPRDL